jgi:GntR family transcriptional regulator
MPLYAQIKEMLQREIEADMKPGDALPPEPELEKRFGVSRITIRRALDELEVDGLIVRQQGRGTFVREPRITQELTQLMSWTVAMRQMGYEPQTISCEIDLVEPTREINSALKLASDEQVVRIRRLRYASGEPVCLMTNYLSQGLVPGLAERGLVDDSLYATLAAHNNIKPMRAEDKVEARAATEWEAKLLNIPARTPLLQVTRVAYDASGKTLYIAVVTNRSDKFIYTAHVGLIIAKQNVDF